MILVRHLWFANLLLVVFAIGSAPMHCLARSSAVALSDNTTEVSERSTNYIIAYGYDGAIDTVDYGTGLQHGSVYGVKVVGINRLAYHVTAGVTAKQQNVQFSSAPDFSDLITRLSNPAPLVRERAAVHGAAQESFRTYQRVSIRLNAIGTEQDRQQVAVISEKSAALENHRRIRQSVQDSIDVITAALQQPFPDTMSMYHQRVLRYIGALDVTPTAIQATYMRERDRLSAYARSMQDEERKLEREVEQAVQAAGDRQRAYVGIEVRLKRIDTLLNDYGMRLQYLDELRSIGKQARHPAEVDGRMALLPRHFAAVLADHRRDVIVAIRTECRVLERYLHGADIDEATRKDVLSFVDHIEHLLHPEEQALVVAEIDDLRALYQSGNLFVYTSDARVVEGDVADITIHVSPRLGSPERTLGGTGQVLQASLPIEGTWRFQVSTGLAMGYASVDHFHVESVGEDSSFVRRTSEASLTKPLPVVLVTMYHDRFPLGVSGGLAYNADESSYTSILLGATLRSELFGMNVFVTAGVMTRTHTRLDSYYELDRAYDNATLTARAPRTTYTRADFQLAVTVNFPS